MKRGKKYNQGFEKLEAEKAYGLAESLDLLKEIANKNFDETVELHIRLSVDPKKSKPDGSWDSGASSWNR